MLKRNETGSGLQRGFTLIEVMIAVAVLSFGLLAVGNFHAKLLKESAYSKARGEAIVYAQEKIEQLRNYSTDHDLVGNLRNNPVQNPAVGQEYTYPVDVLTALQRFPTAGPETINGTNADFSRMWTISRAGGVTTASVTVTWAGQDGIQQRVNLETDLTNTNPRGTVDIAQISNPKVDSPTGKAYLGDGTLDQTAMDKVKLNGTNNSDGTYTADYDGDGDLELIVQNADGTGDVALTLPDACKLNVCTDFVKVNGTIFLDRTSRLSVKATQVFVLASDAAYCARWVPTGVSGSTLLTTSDLTTPGKSDGDMYRNKDAVVDSTGNANNTSDYEYFNYTCYLGGGWYGNIGLVITGINAQAQNNIFGCAGDPEVPLDVNGNPRTTDAWKVVQVVKRRVYRGMIQKYTLDSSGNHVLEVDTNGVAIAKTQGIKDAAYLPDPSWAGHEAGHDFVVVNGNSQTQADCIAALSRPDAKPPTAAVNMFHNVVGDFVCLNADGNDSWTSAPWDKFLFAPWMYLNSFDETVYDAPGSCPYNPSDPPSYIYQITGVLTLTDGPSTEEWGSADPLNFNDIFEGNINTSKGLGDCTVTNDKVSRNITYSCNYYVWADQKGVKIGWNGNVQVDTPRTMECAPNNPYDPANLARHSVYTLSNLTGQVTTADFTCRNLKKPKIEGSLIVDAGNDLTAMRSTLPVAQNSVGAGCVWTAVSPLEYQYSCTVLEQNFNSGYTGDVTVTPPAGLTNCQASSTDGSATVSGGVATFSFTALNTTSLNNNVVCDGPKQQYIISGTAVNSADQTTGLTITPSITGNFAGNCTTQRNINGVDVDYSCAVVVQPRGATFTGKINLLPGAGYWCGVTGVEKILDPVTASASKTLPPVTCIAEYGDVIVSGTVVNGADQTTGLNIRPSITGNFRGACSTQRNANGVDVDYSCTVTVRPSGSTFTGALTLTPSTGYWCTGINGTTAQTTINPVTTSANMTLAPVTCIAEFADIVISGTVVNGADTTANLNITPSITGNFPGACISQRNANGVDVDYSCTVTVHPGGSTYTGAITLTPNQGYWCTGINGTTAETIIDPVTTSANMTLAPVTCIAESADIVISGTAVNTADKTAGLNITASITGDFPGACSTQRNANGVDMDYSCVVTVHPGGATFTGAITLAPDPGYWCGTSGANMLFDPVTTSANMTLPAANCKSDGLDVFIRGSVFVPLSYYATQTLTSYVYMGPGLGDYDMSCNYLGPNMGDTQCAFNTTVEYASLTNVKMISSINSLYDGACNFTTRPSSAGPPTAPEQAQWHEFTCKTKKAVPRNQVWMGDITVQIGTSSWDLCPIGTYTPITTSSGGDLATITYPNTSTNNLGIAPGATVDNVFLGLTHSNFATCSPYATPGTGGPWTWSNGTYTLTANLPWMPTYVP